MANNENVTPEQSAEEREAEYQVLLAKYVEARKVAEEEARIEVRADLLSGKYGKDLQRIARRFKDVESTD